MKSGSESHNRLLLAGLVIAGAIGFFIFLAQYRNAFPAASIDLKLSKPQLLTLAQSWSERIGYKREKLIKSIEFDQDNNAKVFLEFNLGGAAANELMRKQVPVWIWACRFCKEYEQEHVEIDLAPDGDLVRLHHYIANDMALPNVSHDQARNIALNFLRNEVHLPESGLRPVEDSEVAQVHRSDHKFEWEDNGKDWKGARLRVWVVVSGNVVTTVSRYLHVPEVWERKYSTMRTYNQLLSKIATGFAFIFIAWTAYIFLRDCATNCVRWRFVLLSAGAMAAISVASSLNDLPSALRLYEPTTSFQNYLISFYARALMGGVGAFIAMSIIFAAGEATYRTEYGKHMALEWLFRPRGWFSTDFHRNIWLGYCLFGLGLGYQALYYLLGRQVGYWCPLEVGNFQVLSGQIPALSAVATGLRASTIEELLFRVIGLSLCQRILRNFWIANLAQAAIWGFCHSTYPQQPAFARGVELTAVGMVSGWILKLFGLPALLIQHYLFDAFLESEPLFYAPALWDKLSAILAVLLIAMFGLFCAVSRKAKRLDEGIDPLRNEAIAQSIPPEESSTTIRPEEDRTYTPLSLVTRTLLVLAVIAFLLSGLIPDRRVGADAQPLRIDREHAISIASRYLADNHYDFAQRRIIAQLTDGLSFETQDLQYVYEKEGLARTSELAMETARPFIWRVRYFKALEPEELYVEMDGQGQILSVNMHKPEDAPGPKLEKSKAQSIAERFLRTMHPEFAPFVLADASEWKLKNRTDYTFDFAVPKFKVADAEYRLQVSIIGDRPSAFGYYWHLPDQWKFENNRRSTWNTMSQVLSGMWGLVIALASLWWVIGLIRSVHLPWRAAVLLGATSAVFYIASALNMWPTAFIRYKTTTPWANFLTMLGLGDLGGMALSFVGYTLLAVLGLSAARLVLGGWPLVRHVRQVFMPEGLTGKQQQLSIWLDGVLLAFGAVAFLRVFGGLRGLADSMFGCLVPIQTFTITSSVANSLSGGYACLVGSANSILSMSLLVPIICAIYQKYCRNFPRFALLAVVSWILWSGSLTHWQDGVLNTVANVAISIATWLFISRLAGRNVVPYLVYAWIVLPLDYLFALGHYGQPLFTTDYFMAVAILAVPLVYLLFVQIRWRYASRASRSEEGSAIS